RARPEAARGDAAPDPAAHPREGDDRADLAERRTERVRAPCGGGRHRPHRRVRVLGAVRRCQAEEPLTRHGRPPVMRIARRLATMITVVLILIGGARSTAAAADARSGTPTGQVTWADHIPLAPTWFDPAETAGTITSYMVLYALHDAMVKPMPGNPMTPSLAESWSLSPDGLVYEFVLRRGARFHNGEPVTAEDVKFSFERYRGSAQKTLKDRVLAVETPDPARVRIRLKQPWPDFITFYAIATGAGWVVQKKYVEKVGDDGFKKAPIGAGPYKFVSFTPGVELVLEAFDQYWRKTPSVKRMVLKVIPDDATRLAALKRGEVDMAQAMWGALAEEVRRTPGLTLRNVVVQ